MNMEGISVLFWHMTKNIQDKMHTWVENMKDITDEIEEFVQSKLNIKKWRKKEAVEELKYINKETKNIIQFNVSGEYGKLSVSLFCNLEMQKQWNREKHWSSLLVKKDIVDVIKGYRMKMMLDCFKF